jgi:WD40 repeat protein
MASNTYKFVISFGAHAVFLSTPHLYISALALSPESSTVSKYYRGRMQGLMEVKGAAMRGMTQTALMTWTSDQQIRAVAYSPDGTQVATGDSGGLISVRSAQDGKMIVGPFNAHTRSVGSVQFSPDSAHIVSGSYDCTIRVWNAHDGTLVAGPSGGRTAWVTSVQFSPDGTRIVSGLHDCTICISKKRTANPSFPD